MTIHDLLNQWFDIAADDLEVAKGCLEKYHPPKLAVACYHAQQAAEKSLKGFLTYCNIEPPHIHDLSELCKMCTEYDASFRKILELCNDINPYSTITRTTYPAACMLAAGLLMTCYLLLLTSFFFTQR